MYLYSAVFNADNRARFERVTSCRRGNNSVGATESGEGRSGRDRDLNVLRADGEMMPRRISFKSSTNSRFKVSTEQVGKGFT